MFKVKFLKERKKQFIASSSALGIFWARSFQHRPYPLLDIWRDRGQEPSHPAITKISIKAVKKLLDNHLSGLRHSSWQVKKQINCQARHFDHKI